MKTNIYLAGLPRGGTTLVSSILGQHPMIEQMGESMYSGVIEPNNVICSCGENPCAIWIKIYNEISKNPEIYEINRAYGAIDRLREPDKIPHKFTIQCSKDNVCHAELSRLIIRACNGLDLLVRIFKKVMGDFLFVDNTKEIMFSEELIKRDNWKVLLITRDPRGMAWSSRKSGIRKNVSRSVFSKIPVYLDFVKRAVELKKNSNVYHLKYEHLCNDAIGSMKEICNFLNITYREEMIKFKKNKGHTLMGNRMRHDDNEVIKNDLSWKKYLTKQELNLINNNSELVKFYNMLGYSLS
ncbi:MAG: sulfotransferase domain-containing protein [Candidatus Falkowbacteria bacterium]